MSDTDHAAAKALWARARRDPKLANVLRDALHDEIFSAVFLLNPKELFPTADIEDEAFRAPVQAPGVPYLSHAAETLFNDKSKPHALTAAARLSAKRRALTERHVEELSAAVSDQFRDHLALAALKIVRANKELVALVNDTGLLDRGALRRAVRNYEGINTESATEHFEALFSLLATGKGKKSVNKILVNFDAAANALGDESLRLFQVAWTALHVLPALALRRVSENQVRDLILDLIRDGLLTQSSPIFFWCTRCSVWGSIPAVLKDRQLPPLCVACGKLARAVGTYRPHGPLMLGLTHKDGLLGAAVGWHLRERKVRFTHGIDVGPADKKREECDFITSTGGEALIECKMNEVLVGDEKLCARLVENRNQLRDHIVLCREEGRRLDRACCVVNLDRAHLRRLSRNMPAETESDFVRLRAQVISYEDFPRWLGRT